MSEKNALSILDRPEITDFLFYPRKESDWTMPDYAKRFDIITHDGIRIGCRLYLSAPDAPHILFFHGNGEIAQDYDDVGEIFIGLNMNFIVADYRGYGTSEGQPTVTAMLRDSHDVLTSILKWLTLENRTGSLWVMGRSLGSAPALELAALYSETMTGLIVESGFSQTIPLLQRLGIDTSEIDAEKEIIFSNADKISSFQKPTLIIHAQYDQIIPLHHGKELFDRSPAKTKKIYVVPNADHNSILMMAGMSYFEIINDFIHQADNAVTR